MIKEIQFNSLKIKELGRINVFVGKNNCGKTTLLKHIHKNRKGSRFVSSYLTKSFDNFVDIENEYLLKMLKVIEPDIEQIFKKIDNSTQHKKNIFFLKIKDVENPINILKFGDGILRVFEIGLNLLYCKNSLLLVDNIDIYLHHTVLPDVFKIIKEVAEKLDIQIFATAHSWDCVEALAHICDPDVSERSQVTLHRIEMRKNNPIMNDENINIEYKSEIEINNLIAINYSEKKIFFISNEGIECR